MSWSADVVEYLARAKRAGADFDSAWVMALAAHPPRARDVGEWRPTLLPEPGDEVSVVEFMHAACEHAWYRRAGVRHLATGVLAPA